MSFSSQGERELLRCAFCYDQERVNCVFISAAKRGRARLVQSMLKSGADITARDESGHNALDWASDHGHLEVAHLLVGVGVDIHACEDFALRWAATRGHVKVVEFLVENGAIINAKDNWALIEATRKNHPETVRWLIQNGADANATHESLTALFWAAEYGYIHMVQLLIKLGADIHAEDDIALRSAAFSGRLEIVQYLVKRGANVRAAPLNSGQDSLYLAMFKGNVDVVRYLCAHGAVIHAATFYLAVQKGHLPVVQCLCEQVDFSSDEAIHLAMYCRRTDVAEYLQERRARLAAPLQKRSVWERVKHKIWRAVPACFKW